MISTTVYPATQGDLLIDMFTTQAAAIMTAHVFYSRYIKYVSKFIPLAPKRCANHSMCRAT